MDLKLRVLLLLPVFVLNIIWFAYDQHLPIYTKIIFTLSSIIILNIIFLFIEKFLNKILKSILKESLLNNPKISSLNAIASVYTIAFLIFINLIFMFSFSRTDVGKWETGVSEVENFLEDIGQEKIVKLNKGIDKSMQLASKNVVDEDRLKLTMKYKNKLNNTVSCVSKCNSGDSVK